MSRPIRFYCENCGKDITMEGAQICTVCTPIDSSFHVGSGDYLCEDCFAKKHDHSLQQQSIAQK